MPSLCALELDLVSRSLKSKRMPKIVTDRITIIRKRIIEKERRLEEM